MKFLFQKFSPLKQVSFFVLFFISLISLQSIASVDGKIMIKESKIIWEGSKVTGSHEGTVNLESGFLNFKNEGLIGGEFVLDMTSIVCTDLSGKGKASLENHLKNADFFDVNNYPTAELIILGAERISKEEYTIKAEITIKEITQKIAFNAKIDRKMARANLVIDRTLFGIIYKSGNFFKELADKAIYDEFKMKIELVF
tara:strand:+ start:25014 stop:25610 length:597 start_codon:yes stop_codon:yes gene_type:complete